MGEVINRREWGARNPRCQEALPVSSTKGIAVHYSGTMAEADMDGGSVMRSHQRYHMDTKGWCDIAYTGEFNDEGERYEGRGFGKRTAANGTNKGNDDYYAFCFQGADKAGRDDVGPKGRMALAEFIYDYQKAASGRMPIVKPHSDFTSTACPGDELRAYIATKGWLVEKPGTKKYPKFFFLFAQWYLGEGIFEQYGPHFYPVRPHQLPGRFTPQNAVLLAALRRFVKNRK
jgi:hypothetical protein